MIICGPYDLAEYLVPTMRPSGTAEYNNNCNKHIINIIK